jgi:hypothetical protein
MTFEQTIKELESRHDGLARLTHTRNGWYLTFQRADSHDTYLAKTISEVVAKALVYDAIKNPPTSPKTTIHVEPES